MDVSSVLYLFMWVGIWQEGRVTFSYQDYTLQLWVCFNFDGSSRMIGLLVIVTSEDERTSGTDLKISFGKIENQRSPTVFKSLTEAR